MKVFLRTAAAVGMAAALVGGMTACSLFTPTPVVTGTADPTVPPAPSAFETIAGMERHLKVGDFFEVEVPAGDVTLWQAHFSEEGFVTFVPGSKDGAKTWPPGFAGTASGTTKVDLTNGHDSVSFTIVVD